MAAASSITETYNAIIISQHDTQTQTYASTSVGTFFTAHTDVRYSRVRLFVGVNMFSCSPHLEATRGPADQHRFPNPVMMVFCMDININIRISIDKSLREPIRKKAKMCGKTICKPRQLNIHISDLAVAVLVVFIFVSALVWRELGILFITTGCIMLTFLTAAGYVLGCQIQSKKGHPEHNAKNL